MLNTKILIWSFLPLCIALLAYTMENDKTPLILAIKNQNINRITSLLQNKADVNEYDNDKDKRPALYYAIMGNDNNNKNIVKILLGHKADPNIKIGKTNRNPLMTASYRPSLVKVLLKYGANVNDRNNKGYTSLEYAFKNPRSKTIELLCNAGASLVDPETTAFHLAIAYGLVTTHIEKLITCARFDSYDQEQEQKEQKVLEVFRVLAPIPRDIRFLVLEHVTLVDDAYRSNKKLCKKLSSIGYHRPLLAHVHKRVTRLQEILKIRNSKNYTVQDLLNNIYHSNDTYKNKVKSLIDGAKLDNDFKTFNAAISDILHTESNARALKLTELTLKLDATLDPNNLALHIYKNCASMLL